MEKVTNSHDDHEVEAARVASSFQVFLKPVLSYEKILVISTDNQQSMSREGQG
jgi:hypothetical protein